MSEHQMPPPPSCAPHAALASVHRAEHGGTRKGKAPMTAAAEFTPMTPNEMRAAIAALGLTQHGLAAVLGVMPRAVERWCCGDRAIPETIRRIVTLMVETPRLMRRMAEA